MITREDFLKPEIRCDFEVTEKIKRLWKVQLDMLEEFMRICKKHGLRWQVDGGTLIGAVRHNGYIPWDDDLDVVMPRKDYDKLCEVVVGELHHPLFAHSFITDPDGVNKFLRICNSETTFLTKYRVDRRFNTNGGIFIDVIPLDCVPKDMNKRIELLEKFLAKKQFMQRAYIREIRPTFKSRLKLFVKKMISRLWILSCGGKKAAYEKVEGIIKNYKFAPGEERVVGLAVYAPWEKKYTHIFWEPEDRLGETIDMPFEYLTVPVPKNYDRVLTENYGDWHKFVRGASGHNAIEIDPDRSYKDVLKEKYGYTDADFEK